MQVHTIQRVLRKNSRRFEEAHESSGARAGMRVHRGREGLVGRGNEESLWQCCVAEASSRGVGCELSHGLYARCHLPAKDTRKAALDCVKGCQGLELSRVRLRRPNSQSSGCLEKLGIGGASIRESGGQRPQWFAADCRGASESAGIGHAGRTGRGEGRRFSLQ